MFGTKNFQGGKKSSIRGWDWNDEYWTQKRERELNGLESLDQKQMCIPDLLLQIHSTKYKDLGQQKVRDRTHSCLSLDNSYELEQV